MSTGEHNEYPNDVEGYHNAVKTGAAGGRASQINSKVNHDGMNADAVSKPVWYRRVRWWGWVLITVVAVFVVFAGMVGTQILCVVNHEKAAVSAIKSAVGEEGLDDVDDVVVAVQKETAAAKDITNGGLWSFTEKIPGIKGSMHVVRMMTDVVDDLAHDTVPKFVVAARRIDAASVYANGQIKVDQIMAALPQLKEAALSLQRQTEAFDRIPESGFGMVEHALSSTRDMLDAANHYVQEGVNEWVPHLPQWLGYEGRQTYAILAMTPAEMRGSGGLVGAVGTVSIKDGSIKVGDFESNAKFAPPSIKANLTNDEWHLFKEIGPMRLNYDVRDIANSPDTARVFDMFKDIWEQTDTGRQTELNGIILADPLVVQALVRVLGEVTLPDGTVLEGANTADFLQNTVYKKYPSKTDEMFGVVANACVERLTGDLQTGTAMNLMAEMPMLVQHRHLAMYSSDPILQRVLREQGFISTVPLDESRPQIGIYITETNPSKIGWYIKRSTTITQTDCDGEGPDKYHVEYVISNTMTKDESKTLPRYITSTRFKVKDYRGTSFEKIIFMPPAGGTMSNFKVAGNGASPTADALEYRLIYRTMTQIQPESEVVYSFDVTVSPDATQAIAMDETPTTSELPDVTYKRLCRVQ